MDPNYAAKNSPGISDFCEDLLIDLYLPTLFKSVKIGANEINENRTQQKTPSRRVKGKAGNKIG